MITPDKKIIELIQKTNGALSISEAIFIMEVAALAPQGKYIECGVAYGKSAIAAASQLKEGRFILVDPIFESRDIEKEVWEKVESVFNSTKIQSVNGYSTDVIPEHDNYAYAMLDSGDHDEIVMQEIYLIKDRMVSGGIIVMHDLDSQFLKVREGYDYLLSTGNYEEIKPLWAQINDYVNDRDLEVDNASWHHPELKNPNFIGAVRRK